MASAATINRTLNLIIPTASTLPPSLVDLATNLLAQSRAKAPSLKPDEEIARPFACCHIACERLKNRLALEIGKVGPPCGPRIYKRLYAFLDSTLAAVVEPSTPRTKRVQDVGTTATPGSGRSARQATKLDASPSKATPGSLGKRNRATAQQGGAGTASLPRFTMPLIRHVCEVQGKPRTATHVYAGVESVYRSMQSAQELEAMAPGTPSKRRRSNKGAIQDVENAVLAVPTDEQIPALVVVIYLMAAGPMRGEEGVVADEEQRQTTQSAVESYFVKQENSATTPDPKSLDQDVETYLQASKAGWSDMEWYKNLAGSDQPNADDEGAGPVTPRKRPAKTPLRRKEKHSQRKIGNEDDGGSAGLLPGLGTMFQPAVDWLSEDRREDFAAWKQELLGSVAAIEQEVG